MKKILVTTVFALSATTAQATPVDTMCQSVANTAGVIMQARQDGVTVTNIAAALRQSPLNSVSKAHTMIQAAYQQPKYNTDRYVRNAVTEFYNTVYLDCVRDPLSWTP